MRSNSNLDQFKKMWPIYREPGFLRFYFETFEQVLNYNLFFYDGLGIIQDAKAMFDINS